MSLIALSGFKDEAFQAGYSENNSEIKIIDTTATIILKGYIAALIRLGVPYSLAISSYD
jgi:hypothetical protein